MTLTAEHRAAREGKATSSLVAGMLGVDPYRSPRMTYHEIVGAKDELPPVPDSVAAAAERGQRLERLALEYGAQAIGAVLVDVPFRQHPEHAWCGDSADCAYADAATGEVVAMGEAKTVAQGGRDAWGVPGTDQVPDKVMAQCMWHLLHWPEAPRVVVPVLFGGYDFSFQHYVVPRDDALMATIFAGALEFWRSYVLPRVAPPVTAQDLDLLRGRWPESGGERIPTTPEIERWAAAKVHWRAARKAAEKAEKDAEAQLLLALGDADGVDSEAYGLTYRNNRDGEVVDWPRLASDLGADAATIAKYTEVRRGARVLRVTAKKQPR